MKRFLGSCLLSLMAICPAFAALQVGDTAPDFNTQASFGGKPVAFSLQESLKKGPVVVYFYPTAYGKGCSVQAHTFAINKEKFDAAGATIVGVSLDDINRLNDFSADPKYIAGKFLVAADEKGQIANAYGLSVDETTKGRKDIRGVQVDHGSIARTTFIIGTDGKIAATISDLKPAENVEKSLEHLQQLVTAAHTAK
ncbi:MAG: peroxiredoxin [Methylococcales bacterium]|nr:peroxiredoxin [Methylococcaceae bacterium]